jgi:hypothetical protein
MVDTAEKLKTVKNYSALTENIIGLVLTVFS